MCRPNDPIDKRITKGNGQIEAKKNRKIWNNSKDVRFALLQTTNEKRPKFVFFKFIFVDEIETFWMEPFQVGHSLLFMISFCHFLIAYQTKINGKKQKYRRQLVEIAQ